jgi:antitoxin (DNA-binding transcriptional repressor) of toxin-antitoxin stability system
MRSVKAGKGHFGLLVGTGLVLTLAGAVAWSQQAQEREQASQAPSQSQQPPTQDSQTQQASVDAEALHVLVGQSLEVSSPAPIKRFSVANPGIIDAVEENPNQIQVIGKAPGAVSLVVWDETGQSQEFNVSVHLEAVSPGAQAEEALPDKPVEVEVQKKSMAWLGLAGLASIVLLAGAVLRARRRRGEPYLNRFDLQVAKMDLAYVDGAPPLAAPPLAVAGAHPVEMTVTDDGPKQTEDFEKFAQELRERWSQQLQVQAEAAVEWVRGEVKNSGRALEESMQRLASLAEAKLASLSQATPNEYGQQMAQAFREQAQVLREAAEGEVKSIREAAGETIAQLQAAEQKRETDYQQMAQAFREQAQTMHEAADGEMKSIRQATEEAIAQLQAAEQKRETDYQQMAQAFREQAQTMHEAADGEMKSIRQAAEEAIAQLQAAEQQRETSWAARAALAEERLTGMSLALETLEGRVRALVEDLEGKGAKQAEDLQKIAQELGGRWAQQFQEQAEAAVKTLQEEQKNSERMAKESTQELASLAEAQLASLTQIAANATAGLEAEQRRLKGHYQAMRGEFENLIERRSTKASFLSPQNENQPRRRALAAMLAMATGVFLVVTTCLSAVYLWTVPAMQLKAEAPPEFIDQGPGWGATRRVREQEVAQAYWRVAVASLQERYPFGSELPPEPPSEFQVSRRYASLGGEKELSETRDRYWQKLRKTWGERDSWVESAEWDEPWTAHLRRIWDQLHLSK